MITHTVILATSDAGESWIFWIVVAAIGALMALGKFLNDGGHLRK